MPSGKRTYDVAALMDELETLNDNNILKEQTYIGLADALKLLNEAQTRALLGEDHHLRLMLQSFFDEHAEIESRYRSRVAELEKNAAELEKKAEVFRQRVRRRSDSPSHANDQTNTPTAHSNESQ
jgi:hypothetical protein